MGTAGEGLETRRHKVIGFDSELLETRGSCTHRTSRDQLLVGNIWISRACWDTLGLVAALEQGIKPLHEGVQHESPKEHMEMGKVLSDATGHNFVESDFLEHGPSPLPFGNADNSHPWVWCTAF